jgi:hypothetical protein
MDCEIPVLMNRVGPALDAGKKGSGIGATIWDRPFGVNGSRSDKAGARESNGSNGSTDFDRPSSGDPSPRTEENHQR